MSQVVTALKEAGIKLPPLKKRIWLWLKDHPGKSAREVALALNVPREIDVYGDLTDMFKRGMVNVVIDKRHTKKGIGLVRTYTVVDVSKYELKPLGRPGTKTEIPVPTALPEITAQQLSRQLEEFTRQVQAPRPRIDVDLLTVAEARDLYNRLREFFE